MAVELWHYWWRQIDLYVLSLSPASPANNCQILPVTRLTVLDSDINVLCKLQVKSTQWLLLTTSSAAIARKADRTEYDVRYTPNRPKLLSWDCLRPTIDIEWFATSSLIRQSLSCYFESSVVCLLQLVDILNTQFKPRGDYFFMEHPVHSSASRSEEVNRKYPARNTTVPFNFQPLHLRTLSWAPQCTALQTHDGVMRRADHTACSSTAG